MEPLQRGQIAQIQLDAVSLDFSRVKVPPDGTDALQQSVRKPSAILWRMEHQDPPRRGGRAPERYKRRNEVERLFRRLKG